MYHVDVTGKYPEHKKNFIIIRLRAASILIKIAEAIIYYLRYQNPS